MGRIWIIWEEGKKNIAPANVDIGFVYDAVYTAPLDRLRTGICNVREGSEFDYDTTRNNFMGKKRFRDSYTTKKKHGTLAEGWTLSIQHQLDSIDPHIIYKGDGSHI